jgi:hypothetical protein
MIWMILCAWYKQIGDILNTFLDGHVNYEMDESIVIRTSW